MLPYRFTTLMNAEYFTVKFLVAKKVEVPSNGSILIFSDINL